MSANPVSIAMMLCTALGLLSAPAIAQAPMLTGMISGLDVDRIAGIARAYGPAERRFDDAEEGPWIRAEMDGIVYTISFLNCTNATDCTSVQFRAWWNSEGAHSLEAMNRWNRERRFSAAYLDSNNNATLEYDVNLAGGVTAVNFDDTVQWWQAVLQEFRGSVIDQGYEDNAPPTATAPAQTK
jgi:hypothetical protein